MSDTCISSIADAFVTASAQLHFCYVHNLGRAHGWKRAANGAMARARNRAKKCGVKICQTCRGTGVEHIVDTPVAEPCDWCGATGYDEKREERCWKCGGTRVIAYRRASAHVCRTCGGARGFKKEGGQ